MDPFESDVPDTREYELLARAILGRVAADEAVEARRAVDVLFGRTDALELLGEVAIEEAMLGAVLERMHAEGGLRPRPVHHDRRRRPPFGVQWERRSTAASWRARVVKIAAVVLVAVGIAVAVGSLGVRPRARGGSAPEPKVVATQSGEQATIALPDGSRAILAPNSELRYTLSGSTGARELWLDGEAYFDVRHDAAHPFRVRTRQAVIEDLGTAFVVRAYAADARVRVAVRSGRVELRAPGVNDSIATTLRRGEAVAFDTSGAVVRLPGDPSAYWAWTTGRLVFDRTPLPEVLARLHRWYDVDFQLDDATLATQYFTGAFEAATPLPHVLEILGPLVHARFERRGRVVSVTARPGGS